MKAFFVFPSSLEGYGINESTEQPPLGIAYLAATLLNKNIACEILDANFLRYNNEKTLSAIKISKPRVICLSLFAFNFQSGISLAQLIKKELPGTLVIAGGAQPSVLSEKTLEFSRFIDAVVVGEGEMTLLDIMDNLQKGHDPFLKTEGIVYRSGESIVRNKQRTLVDNLDSLPYPAFGLFPDISKYHRRAVKTPAVPMLTSRGCPFGCTFCSNSVFGRGTRFRSPGNVLKEIDYLVNKFNVKQLDIVDDNFITKKERAISLLRELCKKPYQLAINLQSGVSAKLVDQPILELMKKAGVYRIAFGVESGNQNVLNSIKKEQKLEDVEKAVALSKKVGIRTDAFFMIGFPGETNRTMQDTIDFAKKLDPHTANFHMVVPFHGTELYKQISEKGIFLRKTDKGIISGYNYPEAFYEIGHLKKENIENYYKKAYKEFYFRPKRIIRILLDVKSIEELLWLFKTGIMVVCSLFIGRKKSIE